LGPRKIGFEEQRYLYPADTVIYYWVEQPLWAFAYLYRLGVLSKHPLGGGLEIGWLAEGPTALTRGAATSLELDVRMGLPPARAGGHSVDHNIEAGWLIGQWIDNSWFLGYAAGLGGRQALVYGGGRVLRSGTDVIGSDLGVFEDVDDGTGLGRFRASRRSWNFRTHLGFRLALPAMAVAPDVLALEAAAVFPHYQLDRSLGLHFSIGFEWEFK
jgi:hypothetical protein